MIQGRVLNPGTASGAAFLLTEALSFWGGFDPKTGDIIDIHHPQRGANLARRIVLIAETRGSGTSSGTIAEAIRIGTAPAGIIMIEPDVNIAIGASIAETLYGRTCPVVAVEPDEFRILSNASGLTISAGGMITAASS